MTTICSYASSVQDAPAYDDVLGSISLPCLIYEGENTDEYAATASGLLCRALLPFSALG